MRKILKYAFLIVCLVVFSHKISAAIIECEYPYIGMTMTWDTDKPFSTTSNPYVKKGDFDSTGDYTREFLFFKTSHAVKLTSAANIDQNLYKEVMDNYACNDNVKVCIFTESYSDSWASLGPNLVDALIYWNWSYVDIAGLEQTLLIMTEEEYNNSKYSNYTGGKFYMLGSDDWEEIWSGNDGWFGSSYNFGDITHSLNEFIEGLFGVGDTHTYTWKHTLCQTAKYEGPYIGVNINCTELKNSFLEYTLLVNDYKDCAENDAACKSRTISKINDKESSIKQHCSQILQTYDYIDGQGACIDECLKIKDTLNEYKSGTDLYDDGSNRGECGFSARLLVWINNIFRWVKYILPVIVIIMGILDFVKAIAAGKEDEMKKAQGSFTKRLIAAALVFIIPLIIEFILNKMGFGYDTCGLF